MIFYHINVNYQFIISHFRSIKRLDEYLKSIDTETLIVKAMTTT